MDKENKELLAEYPAVISLPVEWGQMDAFEHVNNTVYFRYFESARIAYFEKAGILEYLREKGIGPILKHTQCRFRIPLSFPDTVHAGARVTELGEDSFEMAYRVVSAKAAAVAAEGTATVVWLDYGRSCKTALPAELCAVIRSLESERV